MLTECFVAPRRAKNFRTAICVGLTPVEDTVSDSMDIILILRWVCVSKSQSGLLIASGPNIFVWVPNESPILISERDDHVRKLHVTESNIYDAGDSNRVFDTLSGKEIAVREHWVYALETFESKLYDGGRYEQIMETKNNEVMNWRNGWVRSIKSFQNVLYDGGEYGVYETFTTKKLGDRRGATYNLLEFNDMLLDSGEYGVYDTLSSQPIVHRDFSILDIAVHDSELYDCGRDGILKTLTSEKIASRQSPSMALQSHEGILYDFDGFMMAYETLSDSEGTNPLAEFDYPIHSVVSLNEDMFNKILSVKQT